MLTMTIADYDEGDDSFGVYIQDSVQQGYRVPGILIPTLTGEYGEPSEFIGRTFTLQQP